MRRHVAALLVALGVLGPALTTADEVYYDYAVVTGVQALPGIGQSDDTPLCGEAPPDRALSYRGAGISGLADVIRRSLDAAHRQRCLTEPATRISAYRVQYSYAGTEYTRIMDFDPGDRLRVRVRLATGP